VVQRSTIYEVASRSGVSTATVSRVMDNGTGFSATTRERVLGAARDLGWVPSGSARGLAKRRTGIVGLLFPDFSSAGDVEEESPLYVDQVIRGAERAATAAGDAVLIAATRGSTGRELAFSVAGKVDGLVVMARSLSEPDVASIAMSVPVVILATRSPGSADFDRVGADNRGGARTIVEHLITRHACRDLAFIGGPARSPDSIERFAGFCEALGAAGLPASSTPDARGDFTETGGARAMQELLNHPRLPHAVVCGNDEMAIGALAVLRAARVKVPGDVRVTGFDDIAAARHTHPSLTTVRQPMQDLGHQAVRAVLARLVDRTGARLEIVLPTQPVLRRSCGCRARPSAPRSNRADLPTAGRTVA
jgi:LacI family transcriptional regulator